MTVDDQTGGAFRPPQRAGDCVLPLSEEACSHLVNLHGPMVSIYRWKGKVERDAERQLIIKTTRDRVPALEARLKALHSYELPEFIVVAAEGGSEAYLRWVGSL